MFPSSACVSVMNSKRRTLFSRRAQSGLRGLSRSPFVLPAQESLQGAVTVTRASVCTDVSLRLRCVHVFLSYSPLFLSCLSESGTRLHNIVGNGDSTMDAGFTRENSMIFFVCSVAATVPLATVSLVCTEHDSLCLYPTLAGTGSDCRHHIELGLTKIFAA